MGNTSTKIIDDNGNILCAIFNYFKTEDELKKYYKIDDNIEKFVYLLYFKFNNKKYIKIGISNEIYKRLKNIEKNLQKFDKTCNIKILWINKNTGDKCYECVIKNLFNKKFQKLSNIEKKWMENYIEKNNLIIKKGKRKGKYIKAKITGYLEMYNIKTEDIEDCVNIYCNFINLINKNDSICGKIINGCKKMFLNND